jgi:hypothetical protein
MCPDFSFANSSPVNLSIDSSSCQFLPGQFIYRFFLLSIPPLSVYLSILPLVNSSPVSLSIDPFLLSIPLQSVYLSIPSSCQFLPGQFITQNFFPVQFNIQFPPVSILPGQFITHPSPCQFSPVTLQSILLFVTFSLSLQLHLFTLVNPRVGTFKRNVKSGYSGTPGLEVRVLQI